MRYFYKQAFVAVAPFALKGGAKDNFSYTREYKDMLAGQTTGSILGGLGGMTAGGGLGYLLGGSKNKLLGASLGALAGGILGSLSGNIVGGYRSLRKHEDIEGYKNKSTFSDFFKRWKSSTSAAASTLNEKNRFIADYIARKNLNNQ